MSLSTLADEAAVVRAEVDACLAATAVCEAVLSHPATTPRQAGKIFLLGRWIATFPLTGEPRP